MTLIGAVVHLENTGRAAQVVRLLGEGGQGGVYEVTTADRERLAVKWYHPHATTAFQRDNIMNLVERGAPNQRFLWPSETVSCADRPGFGYAMQLRPPQFVGLAALLNGAVDASLRTVCTIGYQLADSYLMLHSQGLCYRDISFGNVFFDPSTGDTLICDNDNVGVDGETASNVIGTKRFMAPEIVRREAKPSIDTDLYSLSVLLFYLLAVGHPLLGRRELDHAVWNEEAEMQLFGRQPVFIFDPKDESNRPAPGVHDAVVANWSIFPRSLQTMFVRAFTRGIVDPRNGRIRESQWRAELVRCRDLLSSCTRCGAANFFDRDRADSTCWNCSSALSPPVCLVFDDATVVLNESTEITAHHVGRMRYGFDDVVARVTRHPQRPEVWGLTNVGNRPWSATVPDGTTHTVEPGRSVGLVRGMWVQFPTARARLDAGEG
ncbi:MAG: serine/threonine protein kinase [Ilumatobacteraceae bacterium]|jgi:DNA-binding helix-hairpin-helix protein with protein kinase domain